jgi:hypothetical protein
MRNLLLINLILFFIQNTCIGQGNKNIEKYFSTKNSIFYINEQDTIKVKNFVDSTIHFGKTIVISYNWATVNNYEIFYLRGLGYNYYAYGWDHQQGTTTKDGERAAKHDSLVFEIAKKKVIKDIKRKKISINSIHDVELLFCKYLPDKCKTSFYIRKITSEAKEFDVFRK